MRQEGRKYRLEKACPDIGECTKKIQGPKHKAVVMETIRNDLIERRKGIVLNELTLLHQAPDEEDEGLCDRRRNSVARQLRRLKPGAVTGLVALKKRDGNVTIDPQEIASELEEYWQEICKKKEVQL